MAAAVFFLIKVFKHAVAFIVAQQEETQCIRHYG